jgi:hypothetical protein
MRSKSDLDAHYARVVIGTAVGFILFLIYLGTL